MVKIEVGAQQFQARGDRAEVEAAVLQAMSGGHARIELADSTGTLFLSASLAVRVSEHGATSIR